MSEIVTVCPLEDVAAGTLRLVEWQDLEILVASCGGTLLPAYEPVEVFPVRVQDGNIVLEVE